MLQLAEIGFENSGNVYVDSYHDTRKLTITLNSVSEQTETDQQQQQQQHHDEEPGQWVTLLKVIRYVALVTM